MTKVYSSENTSQMMVDAIIDLYREGDTVSPRGLETKELRPVVVDIKNPYNRVSFVKGRKINPFFQMAESLWILAGRSDVSWLVNYNRNMAQFSDDGKYFNAPYGQRLRSWNTNDPAGFIFNPFDQLLDVYNKLKEDKDTRQAVASIYNPMFDNHSYQGKDTPCNLILTFKIRKNKLELTVFNRGNDAIWGLWGANIAQFTTIQEVLASWLGIEPGSYHQMTDSLHTYTKDYGYKETHKIFDAYGIDKNNLPKETPIVKHFTFKDEPRVTSSLEEFNGFLYQYFEGGLNAIVHNDDTYKDRESVEQVLEILKSSPDRYFRNTLLAMFAYRAHRLENRELTIEALSEMEDSQWKLSCLYFMYDHYGEEETFKDIYRDYNADMISYIERG